MSVWQLVIREIARRKVNFISGMVAVTLAVAVLAGAMTMLRLHDLRTDQILVRKQQETSKRMALLEDDYRKIMKTLGFNLLIFPAGQKLADLYADDAVSSYMPENYATRLAEAKIVTIRHLLPSLQEPVGRYSLKGSPTSAVRRYGRGCRLKPAPVGQKRPSLEYTQVGSRSCPSS